MTKFCTDIEQSKKLAEILPIKSADMYWWDSGKRYYIASMYDGDFDKEADIPAWSLDALLTMPLTVNVDNDEYYIKTSSSIGFYEVKYMNVWDGEIHSTYSNTCLIDAAFEMVVLLKGNNKL